MMKSWSEGPLVLQTLHYYTVPNDSNSVSWDGDGLTAVLRSQLQDKRNRCFRPLLRAGIRRSTRPKTAFEHFCMNDAWVKRHGGHAAWQIVGQCSGQAFDAPFRATLGGNVRRCGTAPVRAKIDDQAIAALDHRRHEMADGVIDALDVHVDYCREFFAGNFPKCRIFVDYRRAVHQDVRWPLFGKNTFGPRLYFIVLSYVDNLKSVWWTESIQQFTNGFGRS